MPNHALIVLTGHLGRDAEVKFLPNNTPVTRFTLAVGTGFGEKKVTTWYKCSAFGDRYQKIAQWLTKGKPINIIGEPSAQEWTGENGVKHTDIAVRINDIVLLGSKDDQQREQPAAAAPDVTPDEVPF